jgi:hypothetical protein
MTHLSSAHDDLLRRAAAGDSEALGRLLEASLPLIRRTCPPNLYPWIDDIQQIVAYRLVRKFRSAARPYQVSNFAAYCSFVHRTTLNVSRTIWRRERRSQSLEQLSAATGFEPSGASEASRVNARLRLERCLELLENGVDREIFRRRFLLHETVDETTRAFQREGWPIARRDVYRAVERSILRLSRMPEVRDMFETAGGEE